MATTTIRISEISSNNFVGSTVSLCDQSLIPSPLMAQILTYHWLAHGDYCGYKKVNRPQPRQVVSHVFNSEQGFDFFMVTGLLLDVLWLVIELYSLHYNFF
jgi:hypothetical protein